MDSLIVDKSDIENPNNQCNIGNRIRKFLKVNVNTKADIKEVKTKTVLEAVVHEGLDSENLDDRIEEYADKNDD